MFSIKSIRLLVGILCLSIHLSVIAQNALQKKEDSCSNFQLSYVSQKTDAVTKDQLPLIDFRFSGTTILPDLTIQGDSFLKDNTLLDMGSMGYRASPSSVFTHEITTSDIIDDSKAAQTVIPWDKSRNSCFAAFTIPAPKYLHTFCSVAPNTTIDEINIAFYDTSTAFYSGKWSDINVKQFSISGPLEIEISSLAGKVQSLWISCKKLNIRESSCDSLAIENTRLTNLDIYARKKISFRNVKVESGPVKLKPGLKENETTTLTFEKTDVRDFIFDYKYFDLDSSASGNEYESNLNSILDIQSKYGFSQGKIKADKQLKRLHYNMNGQSFLNWIDEHWWDYGYNKSLIFRNALMLMFFFYIINMLFYKQLLYDTYVIEEFVTNDKIINIRFRKKPVWKVFYKGVYGLLYTGFIFWGVKLDLHKIRFQWIMPALYIILQYLVGITCLAYLANYVISK